MTKQYDNYADLITFTRASTGTYLDSDGLLKTATTNTPRIEYDADGNRLGLLIEEARTNLYINSGDIDGAGWSGFRTTYSAGDTSPDGSQLFLLGTASETNVGGANIAAQGPSLSAGVYTMSVFAKVGPTDTGVLLLRPSNSASFTDAVQAWFNLETGSVGIVDSGSGSSFITTPVATIQDWGNGVYRCSLTFTVTGSIIGLLRHYISDASGSLAVTLGKQVQVWGAQLEAGSFPTSYIPTAGASATRSADVASIPTSAFGYNADKGTVVVEASGLSPATGQYVFNIHDTTANEQIYLRLDSTTIGRGVVFDNGSVVFNSDATGSKPASNTFVKYALSAAQDDFAITANGSTPVVDTSGTMPLVTTLTLGGRETAASGQLNGHIKSLAYYPRKLTPAQLQRLTS